jgi:serine phosphatase RsbU (regulator of sigma subunit)/anti-sigma regulatory factor (Ser/Thr protein kinase)
VDSDRAGADQVDWASVAEALAGMPALVAVTNGPGHDLVYSNAAYQEAFGRPPADGTAGSTYPELVGARFVAFLDDVYHSGQPRSERAAAVELGAAGRHRRRGFFTFVCAPIRAADQQVQGVLVVALDVTEQTVAAERLRRNERLQHETARALQRSLLPQVLHEPDDLQVAVRYLPGANEADVGGDWYDVVPLGAGRTGIVIGDVMGRGVRAAAVMGQLRAAVRAYARLDLPPGEILELLDSLVADLDTNQIVTCCYAVFDPVECTVTYASAGHLPPFLVHPDGAVERLDLEIGAPLGAQSGVFVEDVRSLEEGTFLALYTDGLVEGRDRDLDAGLGRLAVALGEQDGTVDQRCEGVLHRMGAGGDDDVALLLVGRRDTGNAPPRTIELGLSEGREPTRRARAFCHGVLSTWRVPELKREDIVLVVSELVTNAILHGESAQQLRLRRTSRRVVVEVFDNGRRMPHTRSPDPDAETGRGLHLVTRLADRWGARPVHGGKAVWCEFDIPVAEIVGRRGESGAQALLG